MTFMRDVIMVGENGEKKSGAFSDKILMSSLGMPYVENRLAFGPCMLSFVI